LLSFLLGQAFELFQKGRKAYLIDFYRCFYASTGVFFTLGFGRFLWGGFNFAIGLGAIKLTNPFQLNPSFVWLTDVARETFPVVPW